MPNNTAYVFVNSKLTGVTIHVEPINGTGGDVGDVPPGRRLNFNPDSTGSVTIKFTKKGGNINIADDDFFECRSHDVFILTKTSSYWQLNISPNPGATGLSSTRVKIRK